MMIKKTRKKSYVVYIYMTRIKPYDKYIHHDVKEYYREEGHLVIIEHGSNREYRYDMNTLDRIRVQERVEGQYWKAGVR